MPGAPTSITIVSEMTRNNFQSSQNKIGLRRTLHEKQGTVAQGIWPQGTLWNVSLQAWT